MTARKTGAAVVIGVIAFGQLLGCAPEPAPVPTPAPAFASEAEAFAAAEEVYRAYNDALNELDPALPATFEPLYALSSGDFEASDRENFSTMHAEKHVITGDAHVVSFTGDSFAAPLNRVIAIVCLDVSEVQITDPSGTSLVSPERPEIYALSITFSARDRGSMTIDSATRLEDERCAAD